MTHLVEVRHGNACAVDDLATATVCFVYLLPKGNAKLSKRRMLFMYRVPVTLPDWCLGE